MKPGRLLVLSAPSGAGKSTLAAMLLKKFGPHAPEYSGPRFQLSISHTTRPPRGEGESREKNGKHYHFVSEAEFERMIQKKDFLEYARVFNKYYYGTSRNAVECHITQGNHVLFDIDVQGASSLKSLYNDQCTTIFILPPSFEILAKRLSERKTESEEAIAMRLNTAKTEMLQANTFDYQITNSELQESFEKLEAILRNEGFLD